jgi:hypothetical protein
MRPGPATRPCRLHGPWSTPAGPRSPVPGLIRTPKSSFWLVAPRPGCPVATGGAQSLALSQRIDNPWQREARIGAATSGLEARQAEGRSFENDLLARLDQRFFDLLRRQAEQRATQEDLSLAEQIRARVAVRVQTGEAPRYELIKADTELLNAQKSAESAILRVAQARAALRAWSGRPCRQSSRWTGRWPARRRCRPGCAAHGGAGPQPGAGPGPGRGAACRASARTGAPAPPSGAGRESGRGPDVSCATPVSA